MKKIELLAPAGDLEKLKVAILYGADAIYIGGEKYGLRTGAANFTIETMKEALKFAHKHGVKIYVTLNILMHNDDLDDLEDYLKELANIGIDAIIISDLAILEQIKALNLKMPVHISTQTSTLNYEAVRFYEDLNVQRVILGRELSLDEIREIINNTNIEIETFIHGAMCVNYSGRCALSHYLTKRDANRGACAHPCRWEYNLYYGEHPVLDDKRFSMCPKDLSLTRYIPDLIEMGVTSLKIEGRMKSIYYIATVIKIYRKIIDEYLHKNKNYQYNKENDIVLNLCAGRESSTQFSDHYPDHKDQYFALGQDETNQDFLGVVRGYDKDTKEILLEVRNFFESGEEVEFISPLEDTYHFKITTMKDDHTERKTANRPMEILRIPCEKTLPQYAMMRRKVCVDIFV